MKKKIITFIALSFLVVGSAQAGSMISGNPIINLTIDGKELPSDALPVIVKDGRTYVPLVSLKELGLNYQYDAKSKTVNVINQFEPSQTDQPVIQVMGTSGDSGDQPQPSVEPAPEQTPEETPSPQTEPTPEPTPTSDPSPSPTPSTYIDPVGCQSSQERYNMIMEMYREGKISDTTVYREQAAMNFSCTLKPAE